MTKGSGCQRATGLFTRRGNATIGATRARLPANESIRPCGPRLPAASQPAGTHTKAPATISFLDPDWSGDKAKRTKQLYEDPLLHREQQGLRAKSPPPPGLTLFALPPVLKAYSHLDQTQRQTMGKVFVRPSTVTGEKYYEQLTPC